MSSVSASLSAPLSAAPAAVSPAPLVVVLADGLRADVAAACMGYVMARVEAGLARSASLRCDLPGLSRPLYATLLNGLPPVVHGIVTNQAVQACGPGVLHDEAAAGRRSVMVAYHWFYELLAGTPFEPLRHRDAVPPACGLAAARWYFEDGYPDSHAFADAETLRLAHRPQLLWLHPMGPDDAGHRHGGASDAYRMAARRLDALLAHAVPQWHADGWDVLLTSDHGMGADRMHGGSPAEEREVPVVWMPAARAEPAAQAAALALPLPQRSGGLREWVRAQRLLPAAP